MDRVCFTMRVSPAAISTYVAMHAETWPELLDELDRTGWRNYSLFLRDDGLLVGYLESPDWEAAQAGMSRTEVSPRWSAEMDRLVVPGSTMLYPRLVLQLEQRLGLEPVALPHRTAFVLQADGPRIDELRDGLAGLPPSALAALHVAGFRNHSVFLRDDGLLVGYRESSTPLTGDPAAEWLAAAGAGLGGVGLAAASAPLREVFNLGAQLARIA